VENLARLREFVDPAQREAIDAFLATPAARELASSVAESSLHQAPEVMSAIGSSRAAQEAFQSAAPELLEKGVEQAVGMPEAKRQIADRVKRYAIPAASGFLADKVLGDDVSGPLKFGFGMAAGRGVSPMVQALTRMAKTPAVQTQAFQGIQKLLGAAPASGRVAARGAGQEAAEQAGVAANNFARMFPDLSRSLGLSEEEDQNQLALGSR
jgi:hypothetical protein